MKIKNKLFLMAIVATFIFLPIIPTYAESNVHVASAVDTARGKLSIIGEKTGFGKATTLSDVGLYDKIASIINIALGFIGIIAVIFVIYAGFRWITAGGNEEQVTKSKETIRNAVIGIAIIMLAFVITNFVTKSLIDVIQGNGGGGNTETKSCIYLDPRDCVTPVCENTTESSCRTKSDCHVRMPQLNSPTWGTYNSCI